MPMNAAQMALQIAGSAPCCSGQFIGSSPDDIPLCDATVVICAFAAVVSSPWTPRLHSKESRRDESRNAGICAKKHDPKIVYRTTADHSEFMGSRSSSNSCYPTIRPGRA